MTTTTDIEPDDEADIERGRERKRLPTRSSTATEIVRLGLRDKHRSD
jgi:hypothetical protein